MFKVVLALVFCVLCAARAAEVADECEQSHERVDVSENYEGDRMPGTIRRSIRPSRLPMRRVRGVSAIASGVLLLGGSPELPRPLPDPTADVALAALALVAAIALIAAQYRTRLRTRAVPRDGKPSAPHPAPPN